MLIHEVFPYLRVKNAASAIEFYKRAFGARERYRLTEPSGRVGHAELEFGATVIMLSDEFPEAGIVGPQSIGGTTVSIHLHVDDCDAVLASGIEAGAALIRPAQNQFYGERSGTIRDPFGHEWVIGHSIEHLTPEEIQRRYDALTAG